MFPRLCASFVVVSSARSSLLFFTFKESILQCIKQLKTSLVQRIHSLMFSCSPSGTHGSYQILKHTGSFDSVDVIIMPLIVDQPESRPNISILTV